MVIRRAWITRAVITDGGASAAVLQQAGAVAKVWGSSKDYRSQRGLGAGGVIVWGLSGHAVVVE